MSSWIFSESELKTKISSELQRFFRKAIKFSVKQNSVEKVKQLFCLNYKIRFGDHNFDVQPSESSESFFGLFYELVFQQGLRKFLYSDTYSKKIGEYLRIWMEGGWRRAYV